ncbi:MAG: ATP-binding protein [bacterium]|nr:ATP-binding protein [bacterium]
MFEYSRPVFGESFFNREKELEELQHTLKRLSKEATTYLALLGPRKIGKTSTLNKFIDEIADPKIMAFKIDCMERNTLTLDFFLNYLMKTISGFTVKKIGLPIEGAMLDEADLIEAAGKMQSLNLSSLNRAISMLIRLKKEPISFEAISFIVNLPESIGKEADCSFVVIIDEFQELFKLNKFKLTRERIGDVFAFLRANWQNHTRTNYIISGSQISMLKNLLTDSSAPFFQHFKIINVGEFAEDKAIRMLEALSADTGKNIPPELIKKIIKLVGANPFYLQVMGEELCRYEIIDEQALKIALQEVLFNETGKLALYFQDLINKIIGRSSSLENLLINIACQPSSLTELAKLQNTSPGGIKTWLNRIPDILIKENERYQIKDACLSLWLASRSSLKNVFPALTLGDEAEKRVAQKLSRLGFQLVYQSKASRGAFDLLGIMNTKCLGIQVKRAELPLYFKGEELQKIKYWAKELNWKPVIAVYDGEECFFYSLDVLESTGQMFKIDKSTPYLENILTELSIT